MVWQPLTHATRVGNTARYQQSDGSFGRRAEGCTKYTGVSPDTIGVQFFAIMGLVLITVRISCALHRGLDAYVIGTNTKL